MQDSIQRYNRVAMWLHWGIAIFIVAAFVLALSIDAFPRETRNAMRGIHGAVGVVALVLTLLRVIWRLTHRPPPLPASTPMLERRLAGAVHFVLYVLMILVPALGMPSLLYRGSGLNFGLFTTTSPFPRTPEVFRPMTEIHETAAMVLVGLAAAHALAGLYHYFIRRDTVLQRMLPGAR